MKLLRLLINWFTVNKHKYESLWFRAVKQNTKAAEGELYIETG